MKRALRWVGALALALIALAALAIGATLTLLQTRAGGDLARRIALPRINAALAGSVALDELRFHGERLTLTRLTLRDPQGGVVARVARVELAFAPLALLRRHVDIRSLAIERPELSIVQDQDGTNLSRALAPRHPATAQSPPASQVGAAGATSPGFDVDVAQLALSDGRVDFRSLVPGAERRGRLSALALQAHGRYLAAASALEAALDASFDGGQLVVNLDAPCAGCLHTRLETLRLPGALLRGLVPGLALDGPLLARGEGSKKGDVVTADLRLDAGGGWIEARGEVDVARLRAQGAGLSVRAGDIDLSRFSSSAPPSAIGFEIQLEGGGRTLDTLDGSLTLRVPPGRLDRHVLGPVRLTARALHGRYEFADLHATLPGVEVTGHGSTTMRDADVHLRVEAADLGVLARSLAPRGRPLPLVLAGSGRLDVALVGPLAAPTLRVAGQFPTLRAGDQRARGLTLSAVIPNIQRPDHGDLDLAAVRVWSGAQELRGVAVTARAATPRLALSARTTGPFPLTITAAGRRESAHVITLGALTLRYPEGSWALERAARVRFEDGARFAVAGFALRAGRQSIVADVARDQRGTRGRVVISALDLARLPRALLPPGLGLGGILDIDARLAGRTAQPEVDARVALAGGQVRGYRNLTVQLDAHYAGDRARGSLSAHGLGVDVDTRFDTPTAWPPPPGPTPVRIEVALAETDLGAVMKALARASGQPSPAQLEGRVKMTIQLDGVTRAPALAADITATGLAVDGQAIGDVHLALAGWGDRPTQARLDVARMAGGDAAAHTHVVVETPLSLQRVLHEAPTLDELMRTPLAVTGDLMSLPLAVPARLARYPSKVGGALSSHVALTGTALDPRGQISVDVVGATTGRFPPTDARIEVDLDRHAVEARARVVRQRHALLALIARVGVGAAALRGPLASLGNAPLSVRAVLGPLMLERLGLPPETDRDSPRVLKGQLHADLTVDGTLHAPRVVMHANAGDIRLDKSLIGVGQAELRYADRQAEVDARLLSANGGSLHAHATAHADLGYPAVTGLAPEKLPLDVRLDGERFDLQGLSGATQGLRTVGGLIAAAATVRGTIADPRVSGKVEWSNGVVAVTGFGEYKQIRLAVHGDDQNLTLDDLSLVSGSGRAHVTATAAHVAGKGYQVASRADVKGFPIYQEGQPLAAVSVSAAIEGMVSPLASRATIDIHEARVELSDAKRKNLQPLEAPGDVVLVDAGKPLNRAQAKKLEALLSARRHKEAALRSAEDDDDDGGGGGGAAPVTASAARRGVRLTVNAPRKLWVTGKDAYLELGLSPGFRVSMTDETRMFGQVIVHRGRIDVFGRRFDLKADSTLQFNGPPERPEVDVSAQYTNQSENVTVLWTAKGPLDHLTIAVSSPNRPDLTESQLYTLVITGHLQLGGGTSGSSTPTAEASSLLGGALAARLQKTLSKTLPLDVLTIDAGGGEGLTGTQLEAGRYVTDKLYVGYVGRVGADPTLYQNRNAVHVEYQLSSRWGIDGEYGDVGTGSLDLMWKKSY